ncbi:hypothetical protein [Paracoccus sediminicola]|uniref:hypothetical protein n=1 Tax=Paracoccus sediminicola TaxID=3017783 RepID=UPI0022F04E9C|nr:hypothetical protein [Paracoccus sediminicola]WBU55474.1 hypothetical protein PAF18_08000 [Paracoccus sediminicola]
MNRFVKFGAMGAVAALTIAACEPMEEEPISRIEADAQVDETTAPAEPEVASGAVEPANSLNGTYNLRASECGQPGSEGALEVDGPRFTYTEAQCRATRSEVKGDATEVQLTCNTGEGEDYERLVLMRLSPGILQIEEDGTGVRFYRCPDPAA